VAWETVLDYVLGRSVADGEEMSLNGLNATVPAEAVLTTVGDNANDMILLLALRKRYDTSWDGRYTSVGRSRWSCGSHSRARKARMHRRRRDISAHASFIPVRIRSSFMSSVFNI